MKYLVLFFLFCASVCADELPKVSQTTPLEITPNGQPTVKNKVAEPYFTADFIYWKAKEDGLQYVVTGIGSTDQPNQGKGKLYEPDFNGHPGFKVGFGLNIGHDGWDIYSQYTWMHSKEMSHFRGNFGKKLIGISSLQGGVTSSDANWDFHMNVIDLELGRIFYISPSLLLRPFFGLKGFSSNQDYHVTSTGFQTFHRNIIATDLSYFYLDFWGIGIRLGLQTSWMFTRNFSLFGNCAFSNEWSRSHLKMKENEQFQTIQGLNENISLIHFNNQQYQMVPILELAIGFRWEIWFHQDASRFSLQVGWEEQMWWSYTQLIGSISQGGVGDNLNFQGLTIRSRFDF